MKHIHTFENFSSDANEALRMVGGDKILSKMKIVDDSGNWDLNVLELKDDDEEEYYIVTGKYATSATSGDTIWIPKTQWEEFKKMINSI